MSRKYLLLFVLLCALWGFSFVTLKVALPLLFAAA